MDKVNHLKRSYYASNEPIDDDDDDDVDYNDRCDGRDYHKAKSLTKIYDRSDDNNHKLNHDNIIEERHKNKRNDDGDGSSSSNGKYAAFITAWSNNILIALN